MNGLIDFVSRVIEKHDAIEGAVRKLSRVVALLGSPAGEDGRDAE